MQTAECVAATAAGAEPLRLHRVTDLLFASKLRDVVRDLSHDDAKAYRFPGPNPVSLDSTHFPRLAGEPYYVCEKTDGVRYLLACCAMQAPEGARRPPNGQTINVCALVDRALNAYLLPIKHLPKAAYQGSLLDGEVAFNRASGSWEFLIFDAVCVSGIPVLNGTLRDRLDAVHRILRVHATATAADPAAADPVRLRVKTFVPASRLGEFERALPGLKATYDIDGVILTPAAQPVAYGRHHAMFKLKFGSRHTVDFLVGADGRSLSVFDSGSHVQVAALPPDQTAQAPGSIAECALVAPGGTIWTVVTIRTDKTTANDAYTYQKTLLNMREALTLAHVKTVIAQLAQVSA